MSTSYFSNSRLLSLFLFIIFLMIIFVCVLASKWAPQLAIPMKISLRITETLLPILELNNTDENKLMTAQSDDPCNQAFEANRIYETGHMNVDIDVEHICPLKGLTTILLILIASALSHETERMAIRQTWGHFAARRDIGIAFVLGRSLNESENKALSWENYLYGDLIRGNFIDSYNNLTLKTISALEWADHHCNRVKYILKTDDDMFINVPKLYNFAEGQLKRNVKRKIFGRLAKGWPPVRNRKSKYYISPGQYRGVYPPFTTGPAYLLTGDIVHALYVRALKTVYLKLEDVLITGIVAQSLGIKRVHVNEFVNRRISYNACIIRNAISVHMIKPNEQLDLWKKLLDQDVVC